MPEDIMFHNASGLSLNDCAFLVMRYDPEVGSSPSTSDSWIGRIEGDQTRVGWGVAEWLTDLWYSESRTIYVCSSKGRLSIGVNAGKTAQDWKSEQKRGALMGIWGLDDSFVLAWGDLGEDGVMFRWDGQMWRDMPSPGVRVLSVHGVSQDLIYAVGDGGLIARWDGKRWNRIPSPTGETLTSVFVVSDKEMYAVSAGRHLFDGSVHGWAEAAEGPGPLFGVAKFAGQLWVGAGQHGLLKRDQNQLIPVKPNVLAEKLEAREWLFISTPQMTVRTSDGVRFIGSAKKYVEELLVQHPRLWE
jgi:hypothetical protein